MLSEHLQCLNHGSCSAGIQIPSSPMLKPAQLSNRLQRAAHFDFETGPGSCAASQAPKAKGQNLIFSVGYVVVLSFQMFANQRFGQCFPCPPPESHSGQATMHAWIQNMLGHVNRKIETICWEHAFLLPYELQALPLEATPADRGCRAEAGRLDGQAQLWRRGETWSLRPRGGHDKHSLARRACVCNLALIHRGFFTRTTKTKNHSANSVQSHKAPAKRTDLQIGGAFLRILA